MSESKVTNSINTNVEGRNLIIERIFDAPRELVFKAYSEKGHLENWWGPKGWKTTVHQFEFKPGGMWHYCMTCEDKNQGEFYGQESWGLSIYQEIVEPEKIVYTDVFSDSEGNKADGMPEVLITMTFLDHDGKTKLISQTEFATEEALKQVKDMGVVEGVTSQYERFDEYLKQIQ
ncbi:SRPBCC domain-containing protein [Pseudalkalibacillus sp. A8]|uniref:SRPBCC domain-containing protein n=1 Tax=Pseudalkalibacillus sp. A8 TaxID=3382641 RepID=UPI0038B55C92